MLNFAEVVDIVEKNKNHPFPWTWERRKYIGEDIKDANNIIFFTTSIPESAEAIMAYAKLTHRNNNLAKMLRDIIGEYHSTAKGDPNPLSEDTLNRAQSILDEGTECDYYDKELQAYLDVFKGVKTRKEIDEEIRRLETNQSCNKESIDALKWAISAPTGGKKDEQE